MKISQTLTNPLSNVMGGHLWFTIFILLISSDTHLCFGADRIALNQSLTANQTLISAGSRFELGFFKPGNSSNYYLGIWYYRIPVRTVVWVANRESPISDDHLSGVVLKISGGGLILLSKFLKIPIWSTESDPVRASSSSSGGEAVLLDDGNLVLICGDAAGSEILWQWFDNPTDTNLPGAKFGHNKITGKYSKMVSWKSKDDPAPGRFSMQLNPNGSSQFVLIDKDSNNSSSSLYWNSGTWNGRFFNSVPELRANFTYHFVFVENDSESSYTYSLYNKSSIFRVLMSDDGNLQYLFWTEAARKWALTWSQPKGQCEIESYCGAFSSCADESIPTCHCLEGFVPKSNDEYSSNVFYSGCIRKSELKCGSSRNRTKRSSTDDVFIQGYAVRDTASGSPKSRSAGNVEECESICFATCLCNAYAYQGGRCLVWNGEVYNMYRLGNESIGGGVPIYVRVAAEIKGSSGGSTKRKVIEAVLASLAAAVLIGGILLFAVSRTNRRGNLGNNVEESYGVGNGDEESNSKLTFFSIKSVLAATDNFSEANKLGEGGFGPVYKGVLLPGDQEVAVKRLSKKSGQGLEEFMNELKLIAKLQHTHLVRLLGCCVEKDEMILIYEYLPNRSLDKLLFDSYEKAKLDWLTRTKIIEGIAQGLLYIHKYSRLKVIHRDIKASNVLLDAGMNPKISDFGMARIFGIGQAEANTNRIVGTYGYMSPEYAFYGQFSEKSDIFSYGVLLLEIVSGRRNTDFYDSETPFSLLCWAWELWKEGKPEDLLDPAVKDTCINAPESMKLVHVGLLCVQEDPSDRPTMASVAQMLSSNDSQSFPLPGKPAYITRRAVVATGVPAIFSNNQLTMSLPTGR